MLSDHSKIEKGISVNRCEEFKLFKNDDVERVVLWANGLKKSRRSDGQPKIFVVTKRLSEKGLSINPEYCPISISNMTHVVPGSIWKNQSQVGMLSNPTLRFEVDNDTCEVITLQDALLRYGAPASIEQMYNKGQLQNVWMMDFWSRDGEHVIVPCLEYFLKAYGASGELRRVLATYNFDKQGKERLLPPFAPINGGPPWQVKKPAGNFVHNDMFFLAHLKYRQRARVAAKRIYSNIESEFNSKKELGLIKVTPWYRGTSVLEASGEFVSEYCFWVWSLHGMSFPECEKILFITDRLNLVSPEGETDGEEPNPRKVFHKPPHKPRHQPSLVDEPPDRDGPSLFLEGEVFKFIGALPPTQFKKLDKDVETGGGKKEKDEADKAGGGDRSGEGKGVGRGVTHSKIEFANGVVLSIWNALSKMAQLYEPVLQDISWVYLSGSKVLTGEGEPEPIVFEDIDDKADFESLLKPLYGSLYCDEDKRSKHIKACQRWVSSFSAERNRGLVVFSAVLNGVRFFLMEIEREVSVSLEGEQKEESYTGLLYFLSDDSLEISWLREVLHDIRLTKGVFKKISARCPGKAYAFSHHPSRKQAFEGESSLINAFRHLGITFTKLKKEREE